MAKKRPLRSSEEIYHRLRWDPMLPAERVSIGYEDRIRGMVEIPLLEFTPGGRIPWSRVWLFRLDTTCIWDRRARLDRLFGSGETRPDQVLHSLQQRRPTGEGLSARPMFRYSAASESWEAHAGPPGRLPASVSVVSLNVLFDDYARERIDSPRRYAAIAALLAARAPDIIVLQEVQQPFVAGLLAQPWAQSYTASAHPERADTLKPYGQLILSRAAPSRLLQLRLSHSKRILIAAFETGAAPVELAAVHLTSDRREGAGERRAAQIARLLAVLDPSADHLIVGDFNYGDDQQIEALAPFVDAWLSLHPDAPGHTYAPSANALAALFSQRGIDRRLDRLLLRAPPERLLATAATIIADQPIPGAEPVLYPSDHFGLAVTLELGAARAALSKAPTTHHAALAVVPPVEGWGPVQSLRRQHDPSFSRWMPHINLLYGFVPEAHHAAAAEHLQEALAGEAAGTVTLSSVETFAQPGGQRTLYLAPDAPSAARLSALQARLRAALPQCAEQDRGGRFTPHLTIGRLPKGAPVPAEAAALVPWTFSLGALSLLARDAGTPFRTTCLLPLGGGLPVFSPPAPGRTLAAAALIAGLHPAPRDAIVARLREAAAGIGGLSLLGSARLGVDRPDSDIDALLFGHTPRAAAWSALEAALGVSGRRVESARIPVLKLVLGGVPVDVLYAQYPPELPLRPPEALSADQRALLGPVDLQSAQGGLEAEALLAAVGGHRATWQVALRALRGWASARQIDAQGLGYPGGLAWGILASGTPPQPSPEAWLEATLERLYGLDWSRPQTLGPPVSSSESPMQVWTSCPPQINTTASVTRSTLAVIRVELERAVECTWQIRDGHQPWSALLAPVGPENFPARLELHPPPGVPGAAGWLMGNVLGLLLDLERRVALPLRPLSQWTHTDAGGPALVIGLPQAPVGEQRQRVQTVADELAARFQGACGARLGIRLRV